jgi:AcrR family transcriptional regulator
MAAPDEPSLRERQKRARRTAIADAAMGLFVERGFHDVTVDEVARAAGVSKQTVFNYFPVKEELVFDRADEIREAMVAAIRDRPPGTSVVEAFRALTREFWLRIADLPADRPQAGFFRIRHETPALRAYERELGSRTVAAIAGVLREETGAEEDDPQPPVVAAALGFAHFSVFEMAERRILAGILPRDFMPELLRAIDATYDLLAGGLRDYARAP